MLIMADSNKKTLLRHETNFFEFVLHWGTPFFEGHTKVASMKHKILIMGTPVAPGNRGVMALGASIVSLCRGVQHNVPVAFLQVHKPADDILVRMADGDIMVPVVTCRMSPRARLRDNLICILLIVLVYRSVPVFGLRSRIRCSIPWIDAILSADVVGDVQRRR